MSLKNFLTAGLVVVGIGSAQAQTTVTQQDIKTLFAQAISENRISPKTFEGVDGCECMPYDYTSASGKQALLSYCPEPCPSLYKFHFDPPLGQWDAGEKHALINNLQSPKPSFK